MPDAQFIVIIVVMKKTIKNSKKTTISIRDELFRSEYLEDNPSFEDMYPENNEGLSVDFRDALVIFIDRIENYLNNHLSNSALYGLSIAQTELCKLGMPTDKAMNKRQVRAWKEMLMEIEPFSFMSYFDKVCEENSRPKKSIQISGLPFYQYKQDDASRSWKTLEGELKKILTNILGKLKVYKETIVCDAETTSDWNDLIKIRRVVSEYEVQTAQIKRDIKSGQLISYRPKGKKAHILDRAAVEKLYTKRKKSL